jgi:parvulin-like peptidyl-prolyl isomerase
VGWSQTPAAVPATGSQDPNRIVATVNGQKITAKEADDLLSLFTAEQRKQIDASFTKNFEKIYAQKQLAEEAGKLGLEKQEPWKNQLELSRRNIMAQAYLTHVSETASNGPAPDLQAYYNAHKSELETVKLSGIFVGFNSPGTPAGGGANARTEEAAKEKANDLEKKLAAGGDFAALARSDSEHQTASKGGELGTIPINDPQVKIPAEIKSAVAELQPGKVSQPIRINGAYLIVKLDSRETPTFEEAKAGLEQKLKSEQGAESIKKETDKYEVHVEDQEFFNTDGGAKPAATKIPSLQRPPSGVEPKH